jgi:hypothetical protein
VPRAHWRSAQPSAVRVSSRTVLADRCHRVCDVAEDVLGELGLLRPRPCEHDVALGGPLELSYEQLTFEGDPCWCEGLTLRC